jgi:hypothetical protein
LMRGAVAAALTGADACACAASPVGFRGRASDRMVARARIMLESYWRSRRVGACARRRVRPHRNYERAPPRAACRAGFAHRRCARTRRLDSCPPICVPTKCSVASASRWMFAVELSTSDGARPGALECVSIGSPNARRETALRPARSRLRVTLQLMGSRDARASFLPRSMRRGASVGITSARRSEHGRRQRAAAGPGRGRT